MKRLTTTLLIVLAASVPAAAFGASDHVISGAGSASCGKYLEDRASGSQLVKALYWSWLQGFLSGANIHAAVYDEELMVAIPDSETLLIYVDKHCRDNPLHQVHQAAFALYRELPRLPRLPKQ